MFIYRYTDIILVLQKRNEAQRSIILHIDKWQNWDVTPGSDIWIASPYDAAYSESIIEYLLLGSPTCREIIALKTVTPISSPLQHVVYSKINK